MENSSTKEIRIIDGTECPEKSMTMKEALNNLKYAAFDAMVVFDPTMKEDHLHASYALYTIDESVMHGFVKALAMVNEVKTNEMYELLMLTMMNE